MKDKEVNAKIDKWTHFDDRVRGTISGDTHGRFKDGELVITSILKPGQCSLKEGDVVETNNNKYLLGKPAPHVEMSEL
ncbi:MAG: hypothetical protein ACXWT0_03860 [Methylobacter sp.]